MSRQPTPAEVRARLAATVVMLDRLLHDLKQPLNFVRMVAQDVRLDAKRDRLDLEEVPGNMDEIIGAIDKLVHWINQLRAFARPGEDVNRERTVEVADVCRAAAHRLRKTVPNATIDLQLDDGLPPVGGDSEYLEQAVWELLDNALRATDAVGNPSVTVQATTHGEGVSVRVHDEGPPIPEELRSTLFEAFCSGREDAGGLGLTLARALVCKLNAELNLVSSDEQRTTFEVVLPAAPSRKGTTED
jgi:signal transduction histidine kinase